MKLVEAIKDYARNIKTDKTLLDYLYTEHEVAMYDPSVEVEDVSNSWLVYFAHVAGKKHADNVRKVIKHLSQ